MFSTFKASFRVSWAETDAAQIVHFSNYFRFFERTEEKLYRNLGFNFNDVMRKHNILFPRVEAFCQFKKPARFNDLLEVEVHVGEIKRKIHKVRLQNLQQRISGFASQRIHSNRGGGQANRESHSNSKGNHRKTETILLERAKF